MFDLFAPKDEAAEAAKRAGISRIKEQVRAMRQLGEAETVMVTELACAEPGCPPRETVVAVMAAGKQAEQWKFHCAAAEVNQQMLRDALGKVGDS